MKFTRRHARALAAGAATTAAYLAGAKLTDSRYVRGGSLLLLGVIGTLGVQATSAQSRTLKTRLDAHVAATAGAVHLNGTYGTNLVSLANNTTAILNVASNSAFLSALSKLSHQTNANNNITNSNSALTSSDASAVNGVINAMNNLQSHLQSNGFES